MKPKKSMGQNFLTQKSVAQKMIDSSDLNKKEIVLEIGPGKGFLTEEILKNKNKIIVVEKDEKLAKELEEKFKEYIKNGQLKIVVQDILNFNEKEIKEKYKLIANIPYYITGSIIRKFLSSKNQPKSITLMVQKEVALKITKDKKESLLSLSIKAYGKPKYIQTVKAGSFFPKPSIDSAIILIEDISKKFFKDIGEETFFKILKIGFKSKRKTLINNLKKEIKGKPLQKIEEVLPNLKVRAEDLSLLDWKKIIKS